MVDQQKEWIQDPSKVQNWLNGWFVEAKLGAHTPIRRIHEAANAIKTRFCTDGLWAPGAFVIYELLLDGADVAQQLYEDAQPPME